MKLRYLRLQRSRPPLRDLTLNFPQDALLGAQPLTFRFIVGLNGSGKTTLLQTLAEIFVSLDRDGQPPAFPLWLAYDLKIEEKVRTIYLSQPPKQGNGSSNTTLVIFDECLPPNVDWDNLIKFDPTKSSENDPNTTSLPYPARNIFSTIQFEKEETAPSDQFKPKEWPGSSTLVNFLPSAVLAYTSGETRDWEAIFAPTELVLDESAWAVVSPEDERPPDWNVTRENEQRHRLGEDKTLLQAASLETLAAQFRRPSNSFFIDAPQLALAATLITLKHLADQGQDENLPAIYKELQLPWQAPLALSLWVNLDPARLDSNRAVIIADLMKLATSIVREPEPSSWRQTIFDPLARVQEKDYNANVAPEIDKSTGKITRPGIQRIIPGELIVNALLELLGGQGGKIFNVFRTLSEWQQNNLLRDVHLVLRKNDVDDALLFDWLSDGERMFLGRVALFYLLRDKDDALLILDEPETHFNDAWKRKLVDMIDDALRESAHQIVVSTHSSILLSDVFLSEITALRLDGIIYDPPGRTFGTLPSEIMHNLFGAVDPVGNRAKEFLDAVLTLVEFPDVADGLWKAFYETPNPEARLWIGEEHPFGKIIRIFNERTKDDKLPSRTPEQWLRLFEGLYRRTRAVNENQQVTLARVLEMLFDYVGAGYYQFELRRQHRRLTQAGGENASPS